jgi:hypothetical protein
VKSVTQKCNSENANPPILFADSVITTVNRFRYNRPRIFLMLGDHVTVNIISTAALIASTICTLQTHANQTIYAEFVIGVCRENEEGEVRHEALLSLTL